MIQLNEKYYLDSDRLNYIIKEKKIVGEKAKKQENIGTVRYEEIAFFGKIEDLLSWLVDREIRENIDVLNNIKDISKFKQELTIIRNEVEK